MSIEEKVLSGDSPRLSHIWSRQVPFDVPLDSGSKEWQGSLRARAREGDSLAIRTLARRKSRSNEERP